MSFNVAEKSINRPPSDECGPNLPSFLGIHLSGPNCPKTAIVILRPTPQGYIYLDQVYEKIGPKGNLFSDDRLVEILKGQNHISSIVVDQPLSVPPCVSCAREVCPGVMRCDDVAVATMMKVASSLQKVAPSKNRSINPQTQRLWDVLEIHRLKTSAKQVHESTYHGHLAPLVTRALVLKKRIGSLRPEIPLIETSVKLALIQGAHFLGLDRDYVKEYKNFEQGLKVREEILRAVLFRGAFLEIPRENEATFTDASQNLVAKIAESVECFHAFICAWLGFLKVQGKVTRPPETFPPSEGWVYLPHDMDE